LRLYAAVLLVLLQVPAALHALWRGQSRFNGGFARIDRFLLNHHLLLPGFAGFGAGNRRFNGGFTRVDLPIRLRRLRFFCLTCASRSLARFTRGNRFAVVRLLAGRDHHRLGGIGFFSRTRASAALIAS
jgi:hypothetical protein